VKAAPDLVERLLAKRTLMRLHRDDR